MVTGATAGQLDAESLVARMIAELQANPHAQRLMLRALLTNEFLGMPARLDRIEKDVAELKTRVTRIETDVAATEAAALPAGDRGGAAARDPGHRLDPQPVRAGVAR